MKAFNWNLTVLPAATEKATESRQWQKYIAVLWGLVLVALSGLLGIKLYAGNTIDTSLMALFPNQQHNPIIQRAEQNLAARYSQRLLILVGSPKDSVARRHAIALGETLQTLTHVDQVNWQLGDFAESATSNAFFSRYRFHLLNASTAQEITQANTGLIRDRALQALFNPVGSGYSSALLTRDPFAIAQQNLTGKSHIPGLTFDGKMVKLANHQKTYYLVFVTIEGDPYDLDVQHQIIGAIDQAKTSTTNTPVEWLTAGLIVHAAQGARQAQWEISTIGVGSLLGIALLMLLTFRRVTALWLTLLPIASGCLVATAISMLVFHKVHLIAFAFGATIIGVSIDYALHYLCARSSQPCAAETLKRLLPSLLLGMMTSILAYSAQAITPFPGLKQMALFSATGLLAAGLTVICWFPLLTGGKHWQSSPPAFILIARLRPRWRLVRITPVAKTWLLLGCFALGGSLFFLRGQDDIRLLQTSPKTLIEQDIKVQHVLRQSGTGSFLLVKADTIERLLQHEETLSRELSILRQQNFISTYDALSRHVPSAKKQKENVQLIHQLYALELDRFYSQAQLPDTLSDQALSELQAAEKQHLTFYEWLKSPVSADDRYLWLGQLDGHRYSLITLTDADAPATQAALKQMAAKYAWATFVNRVDTLSELLGNYRKHMTLWVLIAVALAIVIMILRYQSAVWRIITPSLMGSSVALLLINSIAGGINLFHMMGLLLVLGVGLDMGIFLHDASHRKETWAAVTLSTLTSLLAFGLLALSKTPVLHHFGLAVLLGLSTTWLITPLMRYEAGMKPPQKEFMK
ncbi:MAG: MMPL family transporter [Gammaproteobacteria bacterium]|nr:MMPL family transporter [Gammaproteobacteria bacterium]